jgi:hypothetical protein
MTVADPKSMSKNDLVREVGRLRALLEQQLAAAPGVGTEVTVQGIVSGTSGEPLVTMRAGEAVWQMTTAQARQHALIILDAAVEAERDAATVAFMRQMALDGGDSQEEAERYAAGFLAMMRDHRRDWFRDFQEDWSHVRKTT